MTMYNSKLLASIKVKGKILREIKDNVLLPFGAEYSILLKNLNTVRSIVNVYIDGDNVVPGGIVLGAGQTVDLERSIKDGNLTAGNKFKFIERTSAIEDGPRGIKLEDGLVRIEYQFEQTNQLNIDYYLKQAMPQQYPWHGPFIGSIARDTGSDRFSISASGIVNQANIGGALRGVDTSLNGSAMQASASSAIDDYCAKKGIVTTEYHSGSATMDSFYDTPKNDTGITVPGSKSTQQFQTTTIGVLESEKHTIVLKLLGEMAGGEKIVEPLTVNQKPKCETCGTTNKATAHFCSKCGTSLVLYA